MVGIKTDGNVGLSAFQMAEPLPRNSVRPGLVGTRSFDDRLFIPQHIVESQILFAICCGLERLES